MGSNLQDLVNRVQDKQEEDGDLSQLKNEALREEIELNGRKKFFELRDKWSWSIIAWISIFIAFHITITVLVGCGVLNFEKHEWLLPSIIAENFLQIVGMGYIIVRFLYQPSK
jgi:hypothetical protein